LPNAKQSGCVGHFQRAQLIGELASQCDLIVLQEMWGANVDEIQKKLKETHRIRTGNESWSLPGSWFQNVINPTLFYLFATGGLWLAHHVSLPIVYTANHQYQTSSTKSGKGVQLTVVDLSIKWPKSHLSRLAIFNTHLDPFNKNHSQEKQISELATFIYTQMQRLLCYRPRRASKIAILLTGDFNITPHDPLYRLLLSLDGLAISARDLHREYCKETKKLEEGTYGISNRIRIDYMFSIDVTWANFLSSNQKSEDTSDANEWGHLVCEKCEVLSGMKDRVSDHLPTIAHMIPSDLA